MTTTRDRLRALVDGSPWTRDETNIGRERKLAIAAYRMAIEDAARACDGVLGSPFAVNTSRECSRRVNALAEGM